jgi:hypothetical protein
VNGTSVPAKSLNNLSNNPEDDKEKDVEARRSPPPTPSGNDVVADERARQKMIIYLSLLSGTNREAANCFYGLMSQVDQTVGDPGWLEKLDDTTLEEVALLYTLGAYHPAFSFEQRLMLMQILETVRNVLPKFQVPTRNPFYPFYQTMQVRQPFRFQILISFILFGRHLKL